MKIGYIIFLLVFVSGQILCAQGKYVKKGDKLYQKGEYYQALLSYNEAKEAGEEISTDVTKKIATCYFELNDTQSAFNTFGEVMDDLSGKDLLTFAKTLQKEGGYDLAMEYYQMAKADGIRVDEVNELIAACKWAIQHAELDQNVRVVPSAIYTAGQSFGTVFYKDGVVYSSAPKDTDTKNLDKTGKAFLDLYYSDLVNNEIQEGRLFSEKLQFQYHIGAIAFTSDYNTMYYTLAVRVKGGNRLKVFKVQYDGKDWGKSEELSFNSDQYDCVTPAVSPDDKFLYFVSNKTGGDGYGGKDIYKVERLRGGSYGAMTNLGPEINTFGNEEFPSINKANELFFSSDGHLGYGGLDIFKAEYKDGKWQNPQNLGLPFNSAKDDFAYTINPKESNRGFLSSNRRGASDDVFYVELLQNDDAKQESLDTLLTPDEPEVGDIIDITALPEVKKEVIEPTPNISAFPSNIAAKIKSTYNNEVAEGINVQVLDKASGKIIGTAVSDANGAFTITIPDEYKKEGQEFELVFSKEGAFNTKRMIVDIMEINDINQNGISLTPMFNDTVLDDISDMVLYYNGTELLAESKKTLERLAGYLQSNPQIVVKLNTHSDARGSKYDNLAKTQTMGEKVQGMLQEKGIDEESTIPRGYGERYIVNRCKRGVLCSEEEQQKNKRIEVIVWKVKE